MIKKRIKFPNWINNFLKLSFGTVLSQVITILFSPIMTRLYSSEEIGAYTTLLSIVTLFGVIMSGRYDSMIVSANDEEETERLISISTIMVHASTVIIFIFFSIYLLIEEQIWMKLGMYSFLVIAILYFTGFYYIGFNYNNRVSNYSKISRSQILRTFIQYGFVFIFGLFGLGAEFLLLSMLLGLLVGVFIQVKNLAENKFYTSKFNFNQLKKPLFKFRDQLFYSTPAHFVNSFSYTILNFLIQSIYGFQILGYYSIAYKILGLPLTIFSSNISVLYYREASEEKRLTGTYRKSLLKYSLILFLIAFPMVIILYFFAPMAFRIFFGEEWYISGNIVRIMVPMFGIRFIVSAVSSSLLVSRKQFLELILQLTFIGTAIIVYFLSISFEVEVSVFLTYISIGYSLIYILFYLIIYRLSSKV